MAKKLNKIKPDNRDAPFQGSYKVSNLPIVSCILSVSSIAFCYIMAQYLNQEPPFPGASITNTSNHYPQFIVFRIAEEGTALITMFIWIIQYAFLQTKAEELGVELFFPLLQLIVGVASNVLFILSTASIDTGVMNGHFHGTCATWFFITTMVNFLFNFISYCQFKLKRDHAISDNSFYVKLLVNVFDVLLVSLESKNIPHYSNIQEYLAVGFVVIYMMTFAYDWKGYTITFSMASKGFLKFTKQSELAAPLQPFVVQQQQQQPMMQMAATNTPYYVQMPVQSQQQHYTYLNVPVVRQQVHA